MLQSKTSNIEYLIIIQDCFARSAMPPSLTYGSSPVPGSSSSLCRGLTRLFHLRSMIVSTAAPRLRLLQLLPDCICLTLILSDLAAAPATAMKLMLPNSIRFSYCSPVALACSPRCSGRFQALPDIFNYSSLSLKLGSTKYGHH